MIVEAFDPVNDVKSSLGTGLVSQLIDTLDLHRLEEAFHRRIIPTICSATHRLQHPESGDQPAVTIACVLAAAVGMHDQPRRRLCVAKRPLSALGRRKSASSRSLIDHPTIRRLAKSITTARYNQPSSCAAIRDVGDPGAIDVPPVEPALKDVRRHWQAVVGIGSHPVRALVDRLQSLPLQTAAYPLMPHAQAQLASPRTIRGRP